MRDKNTFKSFTCSDGTVKSFCIMADGNVSEDIHFGNYTKWNVYLGNIDDRAFEHSLPTYHQYCFESGEHYLAGRY